ncbi:Do family serine endopeptidase [Lishizhenia sp.]|uniref:Do family serine endopeptidase n=1 Tax=Lishizhenia sp. TaxID=2497594 RepID=UPI00299E0470|nr:Do family serine endopeptidase [Lishizhenia sp.]MDX1445962.1 Do family serine endopeptidase [Lishizhenia sp.]
MNRTIKNLGIGVIGGMLPLGAFLLMNDTTPKTNNIQPETNLPVHAVNLPEFNPSITENFTAASDKSLHSVVHVKTLVTKTRVVRDPFYEFFNGPGTGQREYEQHGQGSGSGVIMSEDGYIITNNHVIDDATEIEVTLNDDRTYTATIVGTDPSTDLAVIKIDADNLKPMTFGNSDDVKVGEWVLAVGNPFNLTSTVTAGIVSAKGRNINIIAREGKSKAPIESFIQTDAAVNPGNSGGALVNTKGELVGVNTAIASQTGSYAGYAFAVPANLVKKVMKDIIDYGIVQRAYLGVQIADITQELKDEKSLATLNGVYIAGVVEKSGADKAKLKEGDVITKVGSKAVNSPSELQEEIGKRRPGDKVSLTIIDTDGNESIKEVLLRNDAGETKLISKSEVEKNTALGAQFGELSSKEMKELNIENGVKINALSAGKLKALGLTEGMVITKINNQRVTDTEMLTQALKNAKGGVLLEVVTPSGKKDYVGFGL